MGIYFISSLPKGTERDFISPYKLQNQKGDIFAQNATILTTTQINKYDFLWHRLMTY